MKTSFKKLKNYMGLFRWQTIISKLNERLFIDKKRFSISGDKTPPEFNFKGHKQPYDLSKILDEFNNIKTIYFLVHWFYPNHQGGTERFVLNMASSLKQKGFNVKVITFGVENKNLYKKASKNIIYRQFKFKNIDIIEYRYKKSPRGILKDFNFYDLDLIDFAKRLFKHEKPDLIHCAYPQKTSAFLNVAKKMDIPYILTVTDFYLLCHYSVMVDKEGHLCRGCNQGMRCKKVCSVIEVKSYKERYNTAYKILKYANAVVAPSDFVANMFEKEFLKLKVQVINHGVSRNLYKTKNIVDTKIIRFAYVGTLTPSKGVHLLIEAFKNLSIDYECELNIYGDGELDYIKHLHKISNSVNINFKGSVSYDKISSVYSYNHIIVIPSLWYETYNFVLQEAILARRLLIVSNVGNLPNQILEGRNGFIFKSGDSSSLRLAMIKTIRLIMSGNINYPDISIATVDEETYKYMNLYNSILQSYSSNL